MTYWLSFSDPDLPKGEQFLGACLVEAPSLAEAIHQTWVRRINPGGEVISQKLGNGVPGAFRHFWREYSQRLLSASDVKELNEKLAKAEARNADLLRRCQEVKLR
jgi:hypothetical protein